MTQPISAHARAIFGLDTQMAVWWAAPVECWSAFARLRRERHIDFDGEETARLHLRALQDAWVEIYPSEDLRGQTARLLRLHPLHAHDALQLAAALTWAGSPPSGEIVLFDQVLREAARLEGLTPVP